MAIRDLFPKEYQPDLGKSSFHLFVSVTLGRLPNLGGIPFNYKQWLVMLSTSQDFCLTWLFHL